MFLAAPNCQSTAPSGGCFWAPGPIPAGAWLIFVAIVVLAGLIIYGLEGGRPRWRAVGAWLVSVVVFAIAAEAFEFYAAAAALH